MCNCGKRRAVVAAPGGGGRGGCVGPDCPRGLLPAAAVPAPAPAPAPAPRAAPGSIPLSYRRRQGVPVVVPPAPASKEPDESLAGPAPVDVGLPIVDPALWGPHVWRFLHVTASLPPSRTRTRDRWRALLDALRTALPCPECTGHYQAWHRAAPFQCMIGGSAVRRTAAAWVLALHNDVSRRRDLPVWTARQVEAAVAGLSVADARAALEAALAAGVGPGLRGPAEALLT